MPASRTNTLRSQNPGPERKEGPLDTDETTFLGLVKTLPLAADAELTAAAFKAAEAAYMRGRVRNVILARIAAIEAMILTTEMAPMIAAASALHVQHEGGPSAPDIAAEVQAFTLERSFRRLFPDGRDTAQTEAAA
ncbi:hypothetical protein D3C71_301740 [compost metagenome]